jgi:hypothetical protein
MKGTPILKNHEIPGRSALRLKHVTAVIDAVNGDHVVARKDGPEPALDHARGSGGSRRGSSGHWLNL